MPRLRLFGKPSTLRVVIDTNLFVRGLMKGAATRPLIEAWKAQQFVLVTAEPLLTELVTVLRRDKFHRYFTTGEITELMELIVEQGEIVTPVERLNWSRDPKDNVFLEITAAGHANCIVTGDNDLKDDAALKARMKKAYGVIIVDVPEFMSLLESRRGCLPLKKYWRAKKDQNAHHRMERRHRQDD